MALLQHPQSDLYNINHGHLKSKSAHIPSNRKMDIPIQAESGSPGVLGDEEGDFSSEVVADNLHGVVEGGLLAGAVMLHHSAEVVLPGEGIHGNGCGSCLGHPAHYFYFLAYDSGCLRKKWKS